VEHYRPGLSSAELLREAEILRDAVAAMASEGKAIRHVSSTVVADDDYFQSVLEAKSEALVREAHERGGLSWERISIAIPVGDR
jgi:hypothetical protein